MIQEETEAASQQRLSLARELATPQPVYDTSISDSLLPSIGQEPGLMTATPAPAQETVELFDVSTGQLVTKVKDPSLDWSINGGQWKYGTMPDGSTIRLDATVENWRDYGGMQTFEDGSGEWTYGYQEPGRAPTTPSWDDGVQGNLGDPVDPPIILQPELPVAAAPVTQSTERIPTGTFVDLRGRTIGWDANGQFIIPEQPAASVVPDVGSGLMSPTASVTQSTERIPIGTFVDPRGRTIGWDANGQFIIPEQPDASVVPDVGTGLLAPTATLTHRQKWEAARAAEQEVYDAQFAHLTPEQRAIWDKAMEDPATAQFIGQGAPNPDWTYEMYMAQNYNDKVGIGGGGREQNWEDGNWDNTGLTDKDNVTELFADYQEGIKAINDKYWHHNGGDGNGRYSADQARADMVTMLNGFGVTSADDLKTSNTGSGTDTYINLGLGNGIYSDKSTGFEPSGGGSNDVVIDDWMNSELGSSSLGERGDEASIFGSKAFSIAAAALAPFTGGWSIAAQQAARGADGDTLHGEDYVKAAVAVATPLIGDALGGVSGLSEAAKEAIISGGLDAVTGGDAQSVILAAAGGYVSGGGIDGASGSLADSLGISKDIADSIITSGVELAQGGTIAEAIAAGLVDYVIKQIPEGGIGGGGDVAEGEEGVYSEADKAWREHTLTQEEFGGEALSRDEFHRQWEGDATAALDNLNKYPGVADYMEETIVYGARPDLDELEKLGLSGSAVADILSDWDKGYYENIASRADKEDTVQGGVEIMPQPPENPLFDPIEQPEYVVPPDTIVPEVPSDIDSTVNTEILLPEFEAIIPDFQLPKEELDEIIKDSISFESGGGGGQLSDVVDRETISGIVDQVIAAGTGGNILDDDPFNDKVSLEDRETLEDYVDELLNGPQTPDVPLDQPEVTDPLLDPQQPDAPTEGPINDETSDPAQDEETKIGENAPDLPPVDGNNNPDSVPIIGGDTPAPAGGRPAQGEYGTHEVNTPGQPYYPEKGTVLMTYGGMDDSGFLIAVGSMVGGREVIGLNADGSLAFRETTDGTSSTDPTGGIGTGTGTGTIGDGGTGTGAVGEGQGADANAPSGDTGLEGGLDTIDGVGSPGDAGQGGGEGEGDGEGEGPGSGSGSGGGFGFNFGGGGGRVPDNLWWMYNMPGIRFNTGDAAKDAKLQGMFAQLTGGPRRTRVG